MYRIVKKTPRPATVERFAPPADIRNNTAARRQWCADKLAELTAAGRDARVVGTGSYQEVTAKLTRPVETRMMLTGLCQACGRRIGFSAGTVAHHGYERPGTGWQTASCLGAKHLPLSRSGELLKRLTDTAHTDARLAAETARIRRASDPETISRVRTVRQPGHMRPVPVTDTFARGQQGYLSALHAARAEADRHAEAASRYASLLQERLDAYNRGDYRHSDQEIPVPVGG